MISKDGFSNPADLRSNELDASLTSLEDQAGDTMAPLASRSVAWSLHPSIVLAASMDIALCAGGNAVTLDVGKGAWSLEHRDAVVMDSDKTEHIKEAARVLSRYVSGIGVRAFPDMQNYNDEMREPIIRGFAEHSDVPVFNLESSRHHPFQALADIMTIREKLGSLDHQRVVLSWAFHPKPLPMAVPNSFALIAAQFGLDLTIACPPEYDLGEAMAEIRAGGRRAEGEWRLHETIARLARARASSTRRAGARNILGRMEKDTNFANAIGLAH